MRYATPLLLTLMASLCASCAGRPVLAVNPTACSELIPKSWDDGVPSADLPATTDLAKDPATGWRVFGVAQTGQLDKANDRFTDARSITRMCEARDRAAAAQIMRPWWKLWG